MPKFQKTVQRDEQNRQKTRSLGWNVITVWECELRKPELLADRLTNLLRRDFTPYPRADAPLAKVAEKPGKYRIKRKKD